jgi:hypothetical protein
MELTRIIRLKIFEEQILGPSLVIEFGDEISVIAALYRCHAASGAQQLEVVLGERLCQVLI